jgi:hypothetical protein
VRARAPAPHGGRRARGETGRGGRAERQARGDGAAAGTGPAREAHQEWRQSVGDAAEAREVACSLLEGGRRGLRTRAAPRSSGLVRWVSALSSEKEALDGWAGGRRRERSTGAPLAGAALRESIANGYRPIVGADRISTGRDWRFGDCNAGPFLRERGARYCSASYGSSIYGNLI